MAREGNGVGEGGARREECLAVLLCSRRMVLQPTLAASPSPPIGTANGNGQARINGASVPNGVVLYGGNCGTSEPGGTASIFLKSGDRLALGASAAAYCANTVRGFEALLNHGKIPGKGAPNAVVGVKVRCE